MVAGETLGATEFREQGTHDAPNQWEGLDKQQGYSTSHPMPEGSKGICVLGQLPLLMGLQYRVAIQNVGGHIPRDLESGPCWCQLFAA